MEKIYKKIGRKYVECGYGNTPDLSDGIWLVQSKPHSKSISSMAWKVGNLERPCDVVTHAALQSIEEDLSKYLVALGKVDSKEFIEAKEIAGNWLTFPVQYGNISASQLCSLFLRRIAIHLEAGENMSWDSLQYKFREDIQLHTKPEFQDGVKVLYQFTKWLKENNVKFRQGKNIG